MTSYEAFTADAAELKAITWEAVSPQAQPCRLETCAWGTR